MLTVPLMGVCSKVLHLSMTDDGIIEHVSFEGGCPGNLQAVARLVQGRKADEVIRLLEGIRCGTKPTSCPDQLARVLKSELLARRTMADGAQ